MTAVLPELPLDRRHAAWDHLVHDRSALAGLIIVGLLLGLALAAPWVARHGPNAQDVANRYASPTWSHPFGTDNLGRDELSRILHGARTSLFVSIAVGLAILAVGVVVGTVSGFVGGLVDGLLMRVVDVLLAFPSLLLALAVTGVLGPGLLHLAVAMVAVWWADYARLVRGLILSVRERPYVESARALGMSPQRVATRHVLPQILPPVVVLATLQSGRLLLALSGLSFLGLGVQPPTPEWGAMLSDAQNYLSNAPQLMIYPGAAITVAALGFNLLGDGLRDLVDPNLR
ncbi:MAG: ABC transporter permease [Chloroflexi bacterium]|nr:ABC transporter permease [Chloroflexota bacterium]